MVAGTLYRSPMVKFLSWTIYIYDFESYLFYREFFYEKVFFLSGLIGVQYKIFCIFDVC